MNPIRVDYHTLVPMWKRDPSLYFSVLSSDIGHLVYQYLLKGEHRKQLDVIFRIERVVLMSKTQTLIEKVFDVADRHFRISESNFLPWAPGYHGFAGHIDGITESDLKDHPLVWGYDPHDRSFITFKVEVKSMTSTWKQIECITLYKRYTDSTTVAQGGPTFGYFSMGPFDDFNHDSSIDEKKLAQLSVLFSGRSVSQGGCVFSIPFEKVEIDTGPFKNTESDTGTSKRARWPCPCTLV